MHIHEVERWKRKHYILIFNSINSKMHENEGVKGGVQGNGGQGDECFSPDKGVYIPPQSKMQSVRGRKGGVYRKYDN